MLISLVLTCPLTRYERSLCDTLRAELALSSDADLVRHALWLLVKDSDYLDPRRRVFELRQSTLAPAHRVPGDGC